MMKLTLFWRKMIVVLISILLLSLGWLGSTGLGLLVALTPLLWISAKAEDSKRGWWGCFGWALLTFVGWNISTIWWIGNATPIGPVAATFASSLLSMLAFMTFHTISKKAPKALSYTALVSVWIALEYCYTISEFSWPWLTLGNGFSNDIWAIQWYEFTGVFGGSLWVLLTNILLFEAYSSKSGWWRGALVVALPLALSLGIYLSYDPLIDEDGEVAESMEVAIIQPNIACYEKFAGSDKMQERVLMEMLCQVPETTELILMPETALPYRYLTTEIGRGRFIGALRDSIARHAPNAKLICGANTIKVYNSWDKTKTARRTKIVESYKPEERYHDNFNSAVVISSKGFESLRHKARLVIGVENTPSWIFDVFNFFVIDLGGVVGQLGIGNSAAPFDINGEMVGAAICYEGLYGGFYGNFVHNGAQMMSIISNDGWWGDTPGHKHLYSISSLRAIEHRRAIARSANTGTSGFIDSRGVSVESLGWDQRGVLTGEVALHDRKTLYTLFGDYIARISLFVAALSLLYFVSYRIRRRHLLVK